MPVSQQKLNYHHDQGIRDEIERRVHYSSPQDVRDQMHYSNTNDNQVKSF